MSLQKIKIGVLSTAAIGQRSVIPAILSLSDKFELVGIASRDYEKVLPIAQNFNCKAFGTYEEMLKKEVIDAVYIPLPNSMHFQWVMTALENGLHVLVEKSLGCSLDEVSKLTQVAKNKNLALIENFQFRFHSQLNKLNELLHSGVIGDLRYMRTSFEFPPFTDKTNIRYQKTLGGGALLDAGAYVVKATQLFLGYDISVKAATLRYDDSEVDLGGGAFLKQNNGSVYSEVSFGFDNFYQCNIELFGNKGKISTDRIFTAPSEYRPTINIESQGNPIQNIVLEADNHFVNMINHFYNTIFDINLQEEEFKQNNNQARLLEQLKNANEK